MPLIEKRLAKFFLQYGWSGMFWLLVYPITALLTNPWRLVQSLWASRILGEGNWHEFNRWTAQHALNSLFYRIQAINLYRYGRRGVSTTLGLGHYCLSRWFFNTLPSLYAYEQAGCIVPLVGMFGWWIMHLVWFEMAGAAWVCVLLLLALISTSFYANLFVLQNYNALGWLWFPMGLYGLITDHWWLAVLAWLIASFFSVTVVFIAGFLAVFLFFVHGFDWIPILTVGPAGIKLIINIIPTVLKEGFSGGLWGVLKAIGMFRRGVKYKRTMWKLTNSDLYFIALYSLFAAACQQLTGHWPVLYVAGLVIFLINNKVMRFADVQSMHMMLFSLAMAEMMQMPDLRLLLFFWLVISPLPEAFGLVDHQSRIPGMVPRLAPFSIKKFVAGMSDFLQPVNSGQRVLMAFDDPQGAYSALFDGYRTHLELPHYVATLKDIHFMPDWWAVYETNYAGAPEFWGREVTQVVQNLHQWQAEFVVIYQDGEKVLDPEWQRAGFCVLSEFDWQDFSKELEGSRLALPKWWLLGKPKNV